jgi:hypothetical protein
MPKNNTLCPQGIVRTVDSETNKNLTTTGAEDLDKSDHIEITANGAALNATDRKVTIKADNDNAASTATNVHLELTGKGKSVLYLGIFAAAANLPTHAAEYSGALAVVNVSGTHKLYINTGSAWAVVGTQT